MSNHEPEGNSRPVSSNQQGVHSQLGAILRRHFNSVYRKPVPQHSRQAFTKLLNRLHQKEQPLVLDSFCGTGHSTAALALHHPEHLVVGIDQSGHRLAKHPGGDAENYLLLQAECEDIWRLLLEEGLHTRYHYLLYPNPWPKSKHLGRRIHGHPGFAHLLKLGGELELRSNWQLYVEEFGAALHICGHYSSVGRVAERPPLTLFEDKYRRSGHALWSLKAKLGTVTNSSL